MQTHLEIRRSTGRGQTDDQARVLGHSHRPAAFSVEQAATSSTAGVSLGSPQDGPNCGADVGVAGRSDVGDDKGEPEKCYLAGGPPGARTQNQRIKSPMLYH